MNPENELQALEDLLSDAAFMHDAIEYCKIKKRIELLKSK